MGLTDARSCSAYPEWRFRGHVPKFPKFNVEICEFRCILDLRPMTAVLVAVHCVPENVHLFICQITLSKINRF